MKSKKATGEKPMPIEETQEVQSFASPKFDRNNPLTMNLKRVGKTITVRFPTDDELAKRERRMKTFYKKGSSLPEFDGLEDANLELVQTIRTEGDEVDENSANRIIDIILRAVPDQPVRTPEGYEIPVSVVMSIPTVHLLREPTEKEIRKYREGAIWMGDLKFGRQEARTMLSAVGAFYDKLFISATGYSGQKESIPVIHKHAAVSALISQIKEEQEADDVDPADF